jgi:hypothetical protein
MTHKSATTPRTDAVLSSDHYAKDLLELARTLERELAALREGVPRLREFAQHKQFCDKLDYHDERAVNCTCGLDAALAQEGTPTGGGP